MNTQIHRGVQSGRRGYHTKSTSRGKTHQSRGRGSFSRGKRSFGVKIDVSKFVARASVVEEIPEYTPEHLFADFLVSDILKQSIAAKGYTVPTPIQDKAIPHALKGLDVVGIANTGTGKTAAFLIPLLDRVIKDPGMRVIIVVPTKELALQIDEELRDFARGLRIHSVSCIGGASIGMQMRGLRSPHSFVIGTPGRLKDLIERKAIDMSRFGAIVLDEADRMLDMGFIHDMKFLIARMPKVRQTLFFSATFSSDIERLTESFLTNPVKISVKTRETSANVDQDVLRVAAGLNKTDILHDLLIKEDFTKVLVFGGTKHGVERLSRELERRGFKAVSIHGNKTQRERKKALDLFRGSHVQIMVATDVAARGLDIEDVSHVINYDLPQSYDDYVHRIGRTGRGGKKGSAITFVE